VREVPGLRGLKLPMSGPKSRCLLYCLILAGCSSPFGSNILGYEEQSEGLADVWREVSSYNYIAEDTTLDYWKSPKEFEADGGGDCEDFAAYMIYLLGPEASMAVIAINGFHAVVYWEGELLEPQVINGRWKTEPLWILDYNYVMSRSTSQGAKHVN